ncbi:hypothetical protein DFQ28_007355 [Apophysomyces sp. BC1034]|nr:hypothetical protein DFQ30_002477 [Apophysomyces sp. BC1015]KAG0181385.1 hypothetical protein DFQ29_008442 [Apophysomyces sp. BC1021]KAG0192882.1 hypothetical protein DFQ28_007355 [Apophysomyces sp. BC1034]
MSSAGRNVVQHLLAKHGPLTTKSLATRIPQYQSELISKSHLKHRILPSLEEDAVVFKQIDREPSKIEGLLPEEKKEERVWVWKFVNPSTAEKHEVLKKDPQKEE